MDGFHIKDYQKQKPFASFLSGIAGKKGIPLWAFYVNRGQLIAGFGIRDKNGAIMEFFPANKAYQYTSNFGFRTLIKIDGVTHEFFREHNQHQSLTVYPDRVSIEEVNERLGVKVKVTYHTLPNEALAALVRTVDLTNLSKTEKHIELIDGLAQILPYGIDYGGYKAISNLLQSWMQVNVEEQYTFYRLRASTHDEAEVKEVTEGNFYTSFGPHQPVYIYDYKLLFEEDMTLETPYGFMKHSFDELANMYQVPVNQVPCAMSAYQFTLKDQVTISSLFGYTGDEASLKEILKKYSIQQLINKQHENEIIHDELTSVIETKSAYDVFDQYLKQCYLDNVLRGGMPLIFDAKDGTVGYHIYSRKHGDLERDYNFFTLEPNYYAQGNGNFRDVLQNRRNDLIFNPKLDWFNVVMFTSFIQADGYNPLGIEGLTFTYEGHLELPSSIQYMLKEPFTPGQLARQLEHDGLIIEDHLERIIKHSKPNYKAVFGEGYWEDHFTYLLDLFEQYDGIYPDKMNELLYETDVKYFESPVEVVPRDQKYVLTKDGKVRQYGAIKHTDKPQTNWLRSDDSIIKTSIYVKLLVLAVNKFAHLDPDGIGLSYEGNKPGWNDAANGLPGLFGSGVSEMFELYRLIQFLKRHQKAHTIKVIKAFDELTKDLLNVKGDTSFDMWHQRMTALETYRSRIYNYDLAYVDRETSHYQDVIDHMSITLEEAIEKANQIDEIVPTYLTYEVNEFEETHLIGEYGLPTVNVKSFKRRALPTFLEGPARLLKITNQKHATSIYENVKNSGLFDKPLKMYQTSIALDEEPFEIGRLKAFTKGWLERESNFLHMTYKYLYGLLKAKQYDAFYEEIKTNFVCFMDPEVYGRPPTENVSFIATSGNPDPKKHGQGFVSRLSGSTSEILSMWQLMSFGDQLFSLEDGELTFRLKPKLAADFFNQGRFETTLFGQIKVVYHNESESHTYDSDVRINKYILYDDKGTKEFNDSKIQGTWALDIRNGNVKKIDAYLYKEENNR